MDLLSFFVIFPILSFLFKDDTLKIIRYANMSAKLHERKLKKLIKVHGHKTLSRQLDITKKTLKVQMGS